MSGGRVFQEALRTLDGLGLPPEAMSDLLADSKRRGGTVKGVLDAHVAARAQHPREVLRDVGECRHSAAHPPGEPERRISSADSAPEPV